MKRIQNEKGIALVMVLVLSAVALAVMAGLIFMITGRTQLSGGGKRYATVLDCAKGGIDVVTEIITKGKAMDIIDKTALLGEFAGINFNMNISQECLGYKLSASYSDDCDYDISAMDENTADVFFDLGSDPTCRVYAKIFQALQGNTAEITGLEKGGVATASKGGSGAGEIPVKIIPYDYSVAIESVMIDTATNNPLTGERAKLSVLYAY